ncbi:MAG TPA: quinolinate synthase NadA [Candidatus Norongarragalinales archaeon]|nr:quinolinate synthase NadA [Candidatus Norongarragalinales archaeon]
MKELDKHYTMEYAPISVANPLLEEEAERLFNRLKNLGWTSEECTLYAPLTLEINRLKREKNAVILAHSYQTPDIVYGIADFVGDSYGLSLKARETQAETLVFSGVRFMAETAKILNPEKTVLLPASDAGCSLSESITAEDVRELKRKHPDAAVVVYVNTSADVKAESDVCCTSANALKIINAVPQEEVLFLPDEYMAKNLSSLTSKKIIGWGGRCIVHEAFGPKNVTAVKEMYPDAKILAHTECAPDVIAHSDMAGGTENMVAYIKSSPARRFMLVTECGLTDRMRAEFPHKEMVGTCNLCPYMKKNNLANVLKALDHPDENQIIRIPEDVRVRAHSALIRMFELSR